jgi:ketosteroid isomerase-like protein
VDFRAYEALFNTGDDAALLERFYADDVHFVATSREAHGREALRDFLRWAHQGVREVMRPQCVARTDRRIFAEIDMDFHATQVRADFPFGALRPGDSLTVKFLVTYDLNDDGRIRRLQSMTWPTGRGVSHLPRLGSHPSQLAAYQAYAAAFSAGEHERYAAFYSEDVRLELPSAPPIVGRDGIVGFYRPLFESVRETLTVHQLLADSAAIFADTTSTFTAVRDAPDFVVGALKRGESLQVRVFVYYRLRDGLISSIKVARAGTPVHRAAPGGRGGE